LKILRLGVRKRDTNHQHNYLVARWDLERLRETTLTENSRLEGFRWQPHHQDRVLWANNPQAFN
jgi:hypothetical protein